MPIDLKSLVKSNKLAYQLLFPLVEAGRRLRRKLLVPSYKRETERFRERLSNLAENSTNPFFVKVGANDGLSGDPCSDILLSGNRWRGLLIEPVPYCAKQLHINFPNKERFKIEQIAIGETSSNSKFYCVAESAFEEIGLPKWFSQLGSFDRNHILKHIDKNSADKETWGNKIESFIEEIDIEVLSLSEVLERNKIFEITLLHIDTEGYDYQVLKTLYFSKVKPEIIYIEHAHLDNSSRREMLTLLKNQGYKISDTGFDYFARLECHH